MVFSRKASASGFSIIELMIGSTLFCLAFIMVIGVLPGAFRSTQMTKTYILATQIAAEKLEEAASTPFSQITYNATFPGKNDTHGMIELTMFANEVPQNLQFFYYYDISIMSTDAAMMADDPGTGETVDEIKIVKVTVYWKYAGKIADSATEETSQIEMETRIPDIPKL